MKNIEVSRTITSAAIAGGVMGTAAISGVLVEATVRFLLPVVHATPIPQDATGIIAVVVAVFATLTAVVRAMMDN